MTRLLPHIVPSRTVLLLVAAGSCGSAEEASIAPTDLRCDGLVNPLGIDSAKPRLSWRLEAVRAHYRFVDERLGEVRAELRPGEVLLLAADPGRLARQTSAPAAGLLVLAGEIVAPGDMGDVSERDIARFLRPDEGIQVAIELRDAVEEEARQLD